MHGENLRNPARDRRAGVMRQFPTNQVYSTSLLLYPIPRVRDVLERHTPRLALRQTTALKFERQQAPPSRNGRAQAPAQ
jgi:hypothetical protein